MVSNGTDGTDLHDTGGLGRHFIEPERREGERKGRNW